MLDNLKKYNILLASKSPRRRELLSQLRVPFTVISLEDISENYPESLSAIEVPKYLSEHKAAAYSHMLKENDLIITADTVVILNNKIYGKPKDATEAYNMLMALSGQTHQVVTGVTIATTQKQVSFSCVTNVSFSKISPEDALYYIDTFQPYDKAGAYGIQEWIGCVAVKGIDGSYYNVMGLPVHQLYKVLSDL